MLGKEHKHTDEQVRYWVHVTNKCNWNCKYCIADTHKGSNVEHQKVLKVLNDLPNDTFISLTGGEIGTLSKIEIDEIFEILDNKNIKYCIDTNGLFLNKYPEYYNKVFDYFYHCSEMLYSTDDIFMNDPDNKISYMIVVDDNNIDRCHSFLNKHSNILFHAHAALNTEQRGLSYLNRRNCLRLLQICKNRENVNQDHLKYIMNTFADENDNEYLDSRELYD